MSAAIQPAQTPRERLLENVLDQLSPIYAMIYECDSAMARQAARDAMDSYVRDERTDLFVAGQIIACGLTSMRIYQNCMRDDVNEGELARLTRTADTLSRTAQRYRTSGLYPPAEPKPAAGRTPNQRVAPTPKPKEMPEVAPEPPRQPLARSPEPRVQQQARKTSGPPDASTVGRTLRDRIHASSALSGSMAPQPVDSGYIFSTTGIPNSPK